MEDKKSIYQELIQELKAIAVSNISSIGNISNQLALIKQKLDLFWIGIYNTLEVDTRLGLYVFQGLPACTEITFGKGVCGTSAQKQEVVMVDNVLEYPNYIACHEEARSEIVIPAMHNGKTIFVLDVDSIHFNHFDQIDAQYLSEITEILKSEFLSI